MMINKDEWEMIGKYVKVLAKACAEQYKKDGNENWIIQRKKLLDEWEDFNDVQRY